MDEVAKRILLRLQASIDRRLDAPGAHVLTVVAARREAKHLDQGPDRPLVAVSGVMGDAKTHEELRQVLFDDGRAEPVVLGDEL